VKSRSVNKKQQLFDNLISRYNDVLFKHAFWLTGNRELAKDVVQETYFRAWTSIDKLNAFDKALPWLLTILRRAIFYEQRHQYRQAETINYLSSLETETGVDDANMLLDIYNALDSISPNHREVFLLFHLHEFTYEEISEILQIPKGTVMSRLARAREALQRNEANDNDKIIQYEKIAQLGRSNG